MTPRQIAFYTGVLVVLGAGWGITMPLTKIAVSTGYGHFGLVFWQLVIGTLSMAIICLIRRVRLPLRPVHLRFYLLLALIGTILPNSASYQAIAHLPSGVVSILLSMIPMWAFPMALALRLDSFSWRRFLGLGAGLVGVLMIVGPGVSMGVGLPLIWVLVALISGIFYAAEGNVVAKWGTYGLDPVQVLFGASLIGTIVMIPVVVTSGQYISVSAVTTPAGQALVASSVAHVLVYAGYVWLVGSAGPVFAVQISYLVTLFGVFWAKLILDEAYAPAIWAALALMCLGMYLVQPRSKGALAPPRPIGETTR